MFRLEIFPLILGLWFIITFFITYALAIVNEDVASVWPYISDTGSFAPVSCVFGQLLTIGSILMAITLYIRYIHVREAQISSGITELSYCNQNTAALMLGLAAALGTTIVGNFQESNMLSVHLIGAVMAFGLGSVYQIIMWNLSRKYISGKSSAVDIVRGVLAAISTVCFLLCFGLAKFAMDKFQGPDRHFWKKEDGGYELHLASTITEWICAMSTMMYIMTFYKEFKKIRVYQPTVELL